MPDPLGLGGMSKITIQRSDVMHEERREAGLFVPPVRAEEPKGRSDR
jgi:hypothetical protein